MQICHSSTLQGENAHLNIQITQVTKKAQCKCKGCTPRV